MKERLIHRCLDFICFSQESEGYAMTVQAEQYARQVLDGDLSGDEAVSAIIDFHGLSTQSDNSESADGCYAGSEVTINRFGIQDQSLLDEVEMLIVSVRMAEILASPMEGRYDFDCLKALHARLFSDLYACAGEIRHISVTHHTIFCLPQYIDAMANDIFTKLRDDRFLVGQEHGEFIDNLAYYMAEVHALHPFHDGNTRTLRVFFKQLCQEAGWEMNLAATTNGRLLEADISALEGDYQPLISILHDIIEPL